MWRIVLLILSFTPASVFGEMHTDHLFSTDLFSIEIPEKMDIDESDASKIALVFANDEKLGHGTISVSARRHKNDINQNEVWKRIRSAILNGRTLLNEGEVEFAGHKWKTISMVHATGDCQLTSYAFYTFSQKATFCITYLCKASHCERITNAFNQLTSSLIIK